MSTKKQKIDMTLLYALSYLYLERLDNLKPTEPRMLKFKDDIVGFLEELNKEVMDNHIVQQSTYLYDISKKIDTLMRHNLIDQV